jgi:hypothetical protein
VRLPENPFAQFLVLYALTVAIETPVLLLALSRRHSLRSRLFAGVWLNACSYPVVFFVFPKLIGGDPLSGVELLPNDLIVSEIFAPVSECILFWLAFIRGRPRDLSATIQDMVVVVLANLTSFEVGEFLHPLWQK